MSADSIAASDDVSSRPPSGQIAAGPTRALPAAQPLADPLLRHSLILGSGTITLYGASWLYHVIMSRLLDPADYGALNALIGLLLLLTVPANTLQSGLSVLVARLRAAGEGEDIRGNILPTLRSVLAYGVAAFAILTVSAGLLAQALRLASPIPVVMTGTVLLLWTALQVCRGIVQGMHRFGALAASLAAEGILKVGAGVGLVMLGLTLNGAVAGFSLGALGALLLTAVAGRDVWSGRSRGSADIREVGWHLAPYAAVIGCVTILTQSDVVLMKVFLNPDQAGIYAAASTGGKTILYVTAALPMIVLPETARRRELAQDQGSALNWLLSIGAVGGGVLVACYFLFPTWVIGLLFGMRYLEAAPLLGWIGLGMLAYQLAMLIAYSQVAAGNLQVLKPLGTLAAVFPVLAWVARSNLNAVATLIAGMGTLTLLAIWHQAARGQHRLEQIRRAVVS